MTAQPPLGRRTGGRPAQHVTPSGSKKVRSLARGFGMRAEMGRRSVNGFEMADRLRIGKWAVLAIRQSGWTQCHCLVER